jgi:hypothetical protein
VTFLSAGIATSVSKHVLIIIPGLCCNFSVCVYPVIPQHCHTFMFTYWGVCARVRACHVSVVSMPSALHTEECKCAPTVSCLVKCSFIAKTGHPEAGRWVVSSCCLHNRRLLSASSFRILFLKEFVLTAWSCAATVVLSISAFMFPRFNHRCDCSVSISFSSELSSLSSSSCACVCVWAGVCVCVCEWVCVCHSVLPELCRCSNVNKLFYFSAARRVTILYTTPPPPDLNFTKYHSFVFKNGTPMSDANFL